MATILAPALHRSRAFWIVLALAALLRLGVALVPSIHHADELWQYLEPANHLRGGPWVMTWEYRSGARSWLLPMVFAGPLTIQHSLFPGLPALLLPRLLCVALSLGAVGAVADLGRRISPQHAILAAFVAAIWFEFVYFGARTLSEPIATALVLIGLALLLRGKDGASAIYVAASGGLFVFACLVRIQLVLPIALIALLQLRTRWPLWKPYLLGGLAGLVLGVIPDVVVEGMPLRWMIENVSANVMGGKAASYGTEGALWYLSTLTELWPFYVLPIAGLALIGARHYPVLLIAAVVTIGVHMAIPHKEYRFILMATNLLVVLAAFGSVDAMRRYRDRRWAMPLLGAMWMIASVTCGLRGHLADNWTREMWLTRAWARLGERPDLCGAAFYRPPSVLVASQVLLSRDVPIYQYDAASAAAAGRSRAFNSVLASLDHAAELPGFRSSDCLGQVCVFERPGTCSRTPDDARAEANRFVATHGF